MHCDDELTLHIPSHWHVDSKVWSNWKRILMIKNTDMRAERINLVQELRAELVAWFRIKWEIKACIQQYSVPKPNTMIAPVKCVGKEFVSYKRTIAIYIITLSVIERVLGRLRNACLHKHQAPLFLWQLFYSFYLFEVSEQAWPITSPTSYNTDQCLEFFSLPFQPRGKKQTSRKNKQVTNQSSSVCM